MAKKQTHMGYPGVFPSPDDQDAPKSGEYVHVVSSDKVNSLVKDKDGHMRVVPNDRLQR